MPPQNRAAYLINKHAKPLQVGDASYTPPGPGDVVIRNHAVAINPVDVGKQLAGDAMLPWIKYPFVLGNDVSGTVVEVGEAEDGVSASYLKPGDRVVGLAVGTTKEFNKSSNSAFQQYTVLRSTLVAKIPDALSFENACVLPLGLSTAACGLFMKDYLALQHPVAREHQNTDPPQAVVIWGGSTSVGVNAIQLAEAAGYEVFTTASPKNFDYVRAIGASHVFDYHDPATVGQLIEALKSKTCAGALAIGKGSLEACITIVSSVPGRRFVSQATIPLDPPQGALGLIATVIGYIWWNVSIAVKARLKGVTTKFIWGSDLMLNEVGKMIFNEFLPEALANRSFVAKPDPQVVGNGLESIQTGLDTYKKGVSAKKIVIRLQDTADQ
ncbi:zinc-binding oxidoreductase CipB [Nemania sp. FL0031]|nr:zinc-binding oxidoreductase CipB [Nemania sp. FL0031]